MRAKHSPEDDVEEAVRGILQYLVEHPDAKDTIEGILKWWLPARHRGWLNEEVQGALDFVTSKGWLTKRETTPSKTIYGANKDRFDEIQNFLRVS